MKTFSKFITEASEEQIRAQNPHASPEMVKKAARRSAQSAAQRGVTPKPAQPQKALPGRAGALVKRKQKVNAVVRTKRSGPSVEAVGKSKNDHTARTKPSAGYMTEPDGPTDPTDKPQNQNDQNQQEKQDKKKKKKKKKGSFLRKAGRFVRDGIGDPYGSSRSEGGKVTPGSGTKLERG